MKSVQVNLGESTLKKISKWGIRGAYEIHQEDDEETSINSVPPYLIFFTSIIIINFEFNKL